MSRGKLTPLPMHNKPINQITTQHILSLVDESTEELQALGINPQDLVDIYQDFTNRQTELSDIAEFISKMMLKADGVHSVKYRVKAPQHLLKKIIRKKTEYPDRSINLDTYLNYINDLVGVRVLHKYKHDWKGIGDYIKSLWELKRKPYAYVIKKDGTSPIQQAYKHCGCKVIEHSSGYKAVHFVIETKPEKQRYYVEIQLRTLFEEGWSEIDHDIRYPDHDNSELFDFLLLLLNKLTSKADEMATLMRTLTNRLGQKHQVPIEANELEEYIDMMPIRDEEKQQLRDWILRNGKPKS